MTSFGTVGCGMRSSSWTWCVTSWAAITAGAASPNAVYCSQTACSPKYTVLDGLQYCRAVALSSQPLSLPVKPRGTSTNASGGGIRWYTEPSHWTTPGSTHSRYDGIWPGALNRPSRSPSTAQPLVTDSGRNSACTGAAVGAPATSRTQAAIDSMRTPAAITCPIRLPAMPALSRRQSGSYRQLASSTGVMNSSATQPLSASLRKPLRTVGSASTVSSCVTRSITCELVDGAARTLSTSAETVN